MDYLNRLKKGGVEIKPATPFKLQPPTRGTSPLTKTAAQMHSAEPLPESILVSQHPLAALCRATLDANPAAAKLTKDERRWLAEHLEVAVLGWLAHVFKPEYAWEATCPKGHRVTDGVFVRTLMGWCCEHCKKVYAADECRLQLER